MFSISSYSIIIELVTILILALLIDLFFGEPPKRIHLTVWMGKTAEFLKSKLKNANPKIEKINGIILSLTLVLIFFISSYFILFFSKNYLHIIVYLILASFFLKTSFSIKLMGMLSMTISKAIEEGKIEEAKNGLKKIVRRDPTNFNDQNILSATVECIVESTVDGITSPLFYYSILGVPLALAYRAINTLDSTVGYKDVYHINIGWFSAKMDTLLNYIPARITSILMILSAWILHEDWRSGWSILKRDRGNTESPNAGWTMSTAAGLFNVQLEKPGFYKIGDCKNRLLPEHIPRALNIMKITSILFLITVVLPLIFLFGGFFGIIV